MKRSFLPIEWPAAAPVPRPGPDGRDILGRTRHWPSGLKGPAGGILTSFGLITLFGVADPNSIKPMTQLVVLVAALTFVPSYFRRAALVLPLGLLLGGGGLAGAYAGSTLTSLYLSDMTAFRPLFGVLTLAIAVQIILRLVRHQRTPGGICGPAGAWSGTGVGGFSLKSWALCFSYADTDFRVPLWSPILAGAVISMTAAIFGVGGGFLLVPYLSSVLGLPLHIIPATAAIAIFMSLAVSITNFLAMGARIEGLILLPLAIGTVLGALAGPRINRVMKNTWLQAIMACVVTAIGVKYVLF